MRKKRSLYLSVLFFTLLILLPIQVKAAVPRVLDQADLLTEEEEHKLQEKLDRISKKQKADVIVITIDRLNGSSAQSYADQLYSENGYGYGKDKNGILFLLSMEHRDFAFSTTGFGVTAFTDVGLQKISEELSSKLKQGKYYDSFLEYADLSEEFLKQAHKGTPYGNTNLSKKTVSPLWIPGSFLIGFLGTLFVALLKKSALKSVKFNVSAWQYIEEGSLKLIQRDDRFINKTVSTRKIVRQEQTNRGSSTHLDGTGTQRGGMSGKF